MLNHSPLHKNNSIWSKWYHERDRTKELGSTSGSFFVTMLTMDEFVEDSYTVFYVRSLFLSAPIDWSLLGRAGSRLNFACCWYSVKCRVIRRVLTTSKVLFGRAPPFRVSDWPSFSYERQGFPVLTGDALSDPLSRRWASAVRFCPAGGPFPPGLGLPIRADGSRKTREKQTTGARRREITWPITL